MKTTTLMLSLLLLVIQMHQVNFTKGQEVSTKRCISKLMDFQETNQPSLTCVNTVTDMHNVNMLYLHDIKLVTLPEDAFPLFTDVIEMHLNGSGIMCIHRNAFSKNQKLQKLYLQNNRITNMESGCFNLLENLSILDLSRNKIKSLHATVFDNLKNLQVLNLSRNHLMEINNLHFSLSENLEVLDFSHNNITYVNQTVFTKFKTLQQLFLNDNKLKKVILVSPHIPDSVVLDFSSNRITSISTGYCKEFNINNNEYEGNVNLGSAIIRMSNNKIPGFTVTRENPEFLNVSYNKIATLNSGNFKKGRNLKIVDISHNLVTQIGSDVFDILEKLGHLNLSHNLLIGVEYGTFDKLLKLETLDLSFNRFKTLYSTPHENKFGFCSLTLLYKVNLNGNPWSDSILNRIKISKDIYSDMYYQTEISTTTETIMEPSEKYNFTHLKSNALMLFLYVH